jgi:hypothetical protein
LNSPSRSVQRLHLLQYHRERVTRYLVEDQRLRKTRKNHYDPLRSINLHLWARDCTPGSSLLKAATNVAGSKENWDQLHSDKIFTPQLTTTGVHLEVDSTLRENGCHSGFQLVGNESCAILNKQASQKRAIHREIYFSGSRVSVRGVESTRSTMRVFRN